jgi:tetratricopeptide (TPR) repeat protein
LFNNFCLFEVLEVSLTICTKPMVSIVACLFLLNLVPVRTALADDAKKDQEAHAKTLTVDAKSLEDKGQLKDAEDKYAAAEAIISTSDGRNGLDRIRKVETKKFRSLMVEARTLYDAGKTSEAITKLKEAQPLASSNPALNYNMALCYSKLGDRHNAVAQMDSTLATLPENDKNRDQLEQVRSAMMTGEVPPVLSAEAKQRVDAFNQFTTRSRSVSGAESEDAPPNSLPLKSTTEVPCTQLKDLETSLPKSPSVLFNLAKCAEEEGRQEEALRYLNQYLATAPAAVDKEDVHLRLNTLTSLTMLSGDKGKEVRSHYAAATRFVDDRKYDHAIDELVKAEQIMPDYPLTKWRLALLYEAMGVSKAKEYYASYQSIDSSSEDSKEAAARVATLQKERADYDLDVQEARQTLSTIIDRAMGLVGQGTAGSDYSGGAVAMGLAFGKRPVASGMGGVSFQYAQQEMEAAHKKLEESTGIFPLGPEANELLGFVYLQGHNPSAAIRCYDIVSSQHYPIAFYAKSFSAHDRKVVRQTKVELLPDHVHLVYLNNFDPKSKASAPPSKPAGKDGLGNLVVSDVEPPLTDADLLALQTLDVKTVETKENFVVVNRGTDEIFLEPLNLTSDTPIEGVSARKFANNYSRLFLRYMGYDNTKLGKESMTGGEKFSIGMSFAAAGMSGYSAIASGGLLMASTTQMMMAMYAFNSGMNTLRQSRAEDRQLLEGNQFKLIPSQSFDLAFKENFQ